MTPALTAVTLQLALNAMLKTLGAQPSETVAVCIKPTHGEPLFTASIGPLHRKPLYELLEARGGFDALPLDLPLIVTSRQAQVVVKLARQDAHSGRSYS
jgi:hypothetical protein